MEGGIELRKPSWWRLEWPSIAETASIDRLLYRELKRLIPGIADQVFRIHEPEIWDVGQVRWNPENAYHGREVKLFETFSLIGSMIRQEGFWCRLDSGECQIHVGEGCIYLHSELSNDVPAGLNLYIEAVDSSPYELETHGNQYRLVDESYWLNLERRLLTAARLVILNSWAAGTAGEIWFVVESAEDVRIVRSLVPAPSLLVVFEGIWLESIDPMLFQGSDDPDCQERLYGNLGLLRLSGNVRVSAERPADEEDLRNLVLKGVQERMFLFTWPDSDAQGVTFAAYGESASQLPPFE